MSDTNFNIFLLHRRFRHVRIPTPSATSIGRAFHRKLGFQLVRDPDFEARHPVIMKHPSGVSRTGDNLPMTEIIKTTRNPNMEPVGDSAPVLALR